MTSPAAPQKANRLGLYAPFVIVAIAFAGWSFVWLQMKAEVPKRLGEMAQRTRAAGGELAWSGLKVTGWPFRLDVDVDGISWGAPKGWAMNAPRLQAEASAFTPDQWVVVAPGGIELVRPSGDKVEVTGATLRASISHVRERPPTIALEGLGVTFTPAPGSADFFLGRADEIHVHTRAGPNDQGAFYLELAGAQTSQSSLIGRLAHGAAATLTFDAIYDHAQAFSGPSWGEALAAWRQAGGSLQARTLKLSARGLSLDASGASLSVDADGRLAGDMDANVRFNGASAAGHTPLTFENGRAKLGPIDLGPAPKVY